MMSKLTCPRDGAELVTKTDATHVCVECGGVLVELAKSNNEKLKKIRDYAQGNKKSELVCPLSGETFLEIVVDGVVLDYAKGADTLWLDKGELVKAEKAMKSAKKGTVAEEESLASTVIGGAMDVGSGLVDVSGAILEGVVTAVVSVVDF